VPHPAEVFGAGHSLAGETNALQQFFPFDDLLHLFQKLLDINRPAARRARVVCIRLIEGMTMPIAAALTVTAIDTPFIHDEGKVACAGKCVGIYLYKETRPDEKANLERLVAFDQRRYPLEYPESRPGSVHLPF